MEAVAGRVWLSEEAAARALDMDVEAEEQCVWAAPIQGCLAVSSGAGPHASAASHERPTWLSMGNHLRCRWSRAAAATKTLTYYLLCKYHAKRK